MDEWITAAKALELAKELRANARGRTLHKAIIGAANLGVVRCISRHQRESASTETDCKTTGAYEYECVPLSALTVKLAADDNFWQTGVIAHEYRMTVAELPYKLNRQYDPDRASEECVYLISADGVEFDARTIREALTDRSWQTFADRLEPIRPGKGRTLQYHWNDVMAAFVWEVVEDPSILDGRAAPIAQRLLTLFNELYRLEPDRKALFDQANLILRYRPGPPDEAPIT